MTLSRYRGALLGLACGDAVGTTVEFKRRGEFPIVTDMIGGGPFGLKAGEWTDDTSMALCLATSLLECNGFDADDQMHRYERWIKDGYLSSNGKCFDVGLTVLTAMRNYRITGNPFSGSPAPDSAGNGCLMRLAPVPMFYLNNPTLAVQMAIDSARTTHASTECLEATHLFALMLLAALAGKEKADILSVGNGVTFSAKKVESIAKGEYLNKHVDDIQTTGYVIHSLEAALWCFARTKDFKSAILAAANLGHDADTVAAICGQIAGAFYGETSIPQSWRERLVQSALIHELSEQLFTQRFIS